MLGEVLDRIIPDKAEAAKVGDEVRWDWPLYHKLDEAMKQAAAALGIEIEWGGDWKSFPDGPHFQLPWATYP
jgi:peptidoglycan L-alanyl-D-glutamate endopeptidase CwlK